MSASIPAKPNSTPSTHRRGLRRLADVPFWLVSAVLHAVVLGLLLTFAPVREIVFRRERVEEPQIITRGDELEEVVDRIRDRTVEHLRERVALLDAGQERMARNFTTINEHFQPFAAEQRATARERMESYINSVLPRQQELAGLFRQAREGSVAVTVPIAYSQEWLSRILTAQEEIRRGIRLLELGGEAFLEQQRAAEDKQFEATQFLRWLEGDLGAIDWHQKRLAEIAKQRAENVAKVASETAEEEQQKQAVENAKNIVALREQAYAEARKGKDRQVTDQARRDLDQAKRDQRDFENRLRTAERNRKGAEDRIARADTDTAKAQAELQKSQTNRDNHILAGGNVQSAAYEQQKAVVETVRQLWANETTNPGGE